MAKETPYDGGPAFPLFFDDASGTEVDGMTLRDFYVAAAIHDMGSSGRTRPNATADAAEALADVLLARRKKFYEVKG